MREGGESEEGDGVADVGLWTDRQTLIYGHGDQWHHFFLVPPTTTVDALYGGKNCWHTIVGESFHRRKRKYSRSNSLGNIV